MIEIFTIGVACFFFGMFVSLLIGKWVSKRFPEINQEDFAGALADALIIREQKRDSDEENR